MRIYIINTENGFSFAPSRSDVHHTDPRGFISATTRGATWTDSILFTRELADSLTDGSLWPDDYKTQLALEALHDFMQGDHAELIFGINEEATK